MRGIFMAADIDVTGLTPTLGVSPDKSQIVIQCELVEQTAADPKPSGTTIRLNMTAVDAMHLLALLKFAQQQFGLPEYLGPVKGTFVPPAKDQN